MANQQNEVFPDSVLRDLVSKTIEEHEKNDDTRTCTTCKAKQVLQQFAVKRSYSEKYNKLWISRDSICNECKKTRRRKKNPSNGWKDKFEKRAPFVAALKTLLEEPEALAVLIKYYRPIYEKHLTAQYDEKSKLALQQQKNLMIAASKRQDQRKNTYSVGNRGRGDSVQVRTDATVMYAVNNSEVHPRLNHQQVRDIRIRAELDGTPAADMAKEYGVKESTIRSVIAGRSFQNVR